MISLFYKFSSTKLQGVVNFSLLLSLCWLCTGGRIFCKCCRSQSWFELRKFSFKAKQSWSWKWWPKCWGWPEFLIDAIRKRLAQSRIKAQGWYFCTFFCIIVLDNLLRSLVLLFLFFRCEVDCRISASDYGVAAKSPSRARKKERVQWSRDHAIAESNAHSLSGLHESFYCSWWTANIWTNEETRRSSSAQHASPSSTPSRLIKLPSERLWHVLMFFFGRLDMPQLVPWFYFFGILGRC